MVGYQEKVNILAYPDEKRAVASLYTSASPSMADPGSQETLLIAAAIVLPIPQPITPRLWQPQDPAGGTFRAAIGLPVQPPIAGTFFVGYGTQTSGTITSGKRYELVDFIAGDDFTNVGAGSNADGVVFVATGTTPTTWTNSSVVSEITTDLPYNIGAVAFAAALNLMHSITAAGGVTVQLISEQFIVSFLTHGTREEFTGGTANLAPTGTIAEIGFELEGSSTVSAVEYLRFVQSPAAFVDLVTGPPTPAGTVDVLSIGGAGPPETNASYLVTLFTSDLNQPYDGTWSLSFLGKTTPTIAFDASAEGVIDAFAQMTMFAPTNYDISAVRVTKQAPGIYIIGFQNALAGFNVGTMTVDASGLRCVQYMSGALSLDNPAIQLLFGEATSVAAIFVIENTPSGGSRREIFRADVRLDQSLIPEGALTPTPRILFYTKAETDAAIAAAIGGLVFGTIACQDADNVAITGGTGDGLTLTNTLINGLTIDTSSGISFIAGITGFTIGVGGDFFVATGKAAGFINSIQISGTDLATFDVGAGGTLGSGAFNPLVIGANPTGTIGLTAVNGTATTYLRSDGAPALSQAIVPTWTGAHTWSAAVTFNAAFTCSPASGAVTFNPTSTGSIDNLTLGSTTPKPVQASTLKVGPSATPGTLTTRIKHGVATLVLGTVTVGEATVTTSSRIMLSIMSLGTVAAPKALGITARVASTSFTITSADATDTSVVAWLLIEN